MLHHYCGRQVSSAAARKLKTDGMPYTVNIEVLDNLIRL